MALFSCKSSSRRVSTVVTCVLFSHTGAHWNNPGTRLWLAEFLSLLPKTIQQIGVQCWSWFALLLLFSKYGFWRWEIDPTLLPDTVDVRYFSKLNTVKYLKRVKWWERCSYLHSQPSLSCMCSPGGAKRKKKHWLLTLCYILAMQNTYQNKNYMYIYFLF